jgi:peptidoglycan/xylan/chitin deacetylase (PgdA/CDA1 family)
MGVMTGNHNQATAAPDQEEGLLELPTAVVDELSRKREQVARERQGRRKGRLRTRRIVVAAAPLVLALAWYFHPMRVEVTGRGVWVERWTSVHRAVFGSGVPLPYGDLVDVRGGILKPGGGHSPVPLSGGRPVPYDAKAYRFRRLTLRRGADQREPYREEAALTPAPHHAWGVTYLPAGLGIAGVTRSEIGTVSGLRLVADDVRATPIPGSREARAFLPKRMALTFDDGPNGETTKRLLAILAQNRAHATFFLLGDCIGHEEEIVRQELAAGHEIGNHSWGHPLMTRMTAPEVIANLQRAETIIGAASGKHCRWFRPPYGELNSAERKAILEAGYSIALWSADTEDWRKPGADKIYERIMAGAEPGAVVLCHDGGGSREQTLDAVSRAVPDLIAAGYELVTLSELSQSLPGEDAGIILLSGKQEWRARLPKEPIRVLVRGQELTGLSPILVLKGKALLPAAKVLDALGVTWQWDRQAQALDITSAQARVRLRLDSPRVLWNNQELTLDVPPVLYHDIPLVSAEVLARAAGVQLEESAEPKTYTFTVAAPTEGKTGGAK